MEHGGGRYSASLGRRISIPADVRGLEAQRCSWVAASLTGESEPIEKTPLVCVPQDSVTDYTDIAFMGSDVIVRQRHRRGSLRGRPRLSSVPWPAVAGEWVESPASPNATPFAWVLIHFMVPLVLFINGITKGDWLEAFFVRGLSP